MCRFCHNPPAEEYLLESLSVQNPECADILKDVCTLCGFQLLDKTCEWVGNELIRRDYLLVSAIAKRLAVIAHRKEKNKSLDICEAEFGAWGDGPHLRCNHYVTTECNGMQVCGYHAAHFKKTGAVSCRKFVPGICRYKRSFGEFNEIT